MRSFLLRSLFFLAFLTIVISETRLQHYRGRGRISGRAPFIHSPIVKRANGEELWDAVQDTRRCRFLDQDQNRAKLQNYAPCDPDQVDHPGPWDIRDALNALPGAGGDVRFTYRNVCSALQPRNPNAVCYENAFSPSSGVIMAMINYGSQDAVPAAQRLHWSDYVYYTYEQLGGIPANLNYIVQRGIINANTNTVINNAYASNHVARNTRQSWSPANPYRKQYFLDILGTQNAYGAAYMLTQHGRAMGYKTIKEIITLPFDINRPDVRPSFIIVLG